MDYPSVAVSLINPLSFLGVLVAVHLTAPVGKRMWSLIGVVFGSLWVAVSVPAYFLQLTVVRWGDTSVRSFADLRAARWAQNVLGWGLFLGIAALASSRVFEGTRRARARDLVERYRRDVQPTSAEARADIAATRARVMHTLYAGAQGNAVALREYATDLRDRCALIPEGAGPSDRGRAFVR